MKSSAAGTASGPFAKQRKGSLVVAKENINIASDKESSVNVYKQPFTIRN